MTHPRKLLKFALWGSGYLTAFAVAFVLSFYFAAYGRHRAAFQHDALDSDLQAALLEYRVMSQDGATKLAALSEYLGYLEGGPLQTERQFRSYFAAEKALTLARLAVTARQMGQQKEGQQFMERALALCIDMKWSTCGEEELTEGATKLDSGWSDFGASPK